eukprot:TRINITY_DN2051_c0_g1_i1.p1 TRINITY_DN2051_c0_g1~~TRINITY_DN2051_c0_g1_i1.p1  ORF type:complete len:252 (+),score=18.21 TRINITY_DN2051_c0_g1_i1:156-911(+)
MITVILALVVVSLAAPPPYPIYESYGPNQLFNQEGQSIKTTNGNQAMYSVSADQCAAVCNWMGRQCDCCNSFSYQPRSGKCYLKKRSESASDARSYNADGWQSYKYWGLSHPAFGYEGDLPETANGHSVGTPPGIWLYSKSFVGKGPNQLAVFEGNPVKTSRGFDGESGLSVKECAEMCLRYTCDGFAYNPNQDGGKCFLKMDSASGKYNTVYNSDGWTFYWLEDNLDKCFCTCASDFVCITCEGDQCDAY